MKKIVCLCLFIVSCSTLAKGQFFASETRQNKAPQAFALQPASYEFLQQSHPLTVQHANRLVDAIRANKALMAAINQWPSLTIEQQIPWLEVLFKMEYQSVGISPPTLIIDNSSYPGKTVYFDFDVEAPRTGTVYLNPDKLAAMDKYSSLSFLLHETRHSYQFQLAFQGESTVLGQGYRAAFVEQKHSAPGELTFCDFLTLVNEYEAFQFANYVVGSLTHWQVEQPKMGTFASQFDHHGTLKIDLLELFHRESDTPVIRQFNELQKAQHALLGQ